MTFWILPIVCATGLLATAVLADKRHPRALVLSAIAWPGLVPAMLPWLHLWALVVLWVACWCMWPTRKLDYGYRKVVSVSVLATLYVVAVSLYPHRYPVVLLGFALMPLFPFHGHVQEWPRRVPYHLGTWVVAVMGLAALQWFGPSQLAMGWAGWSALVFAVLSLAQTDSRRYAVTLILALECHWWSRQNPALPLGSLAVALMMIVTAMAGMRSSFKSYQLADYRGAMAWSLLLIIGTLWVSPVVVPDPVAGQLDAESLLVMMTWVLILIGPMRILARSSAVRTTLHWPEASEKALANSS